MTKASDPHWAVILGCSSGTGAAIARQLAVDPGLNLFGVHRGKHPDGAIAVERAAEAAGRRVCLVGRSMIRMAEASCKASL